MVRRLLSLQRPLVGRPLARTRRAAAAATGVALLALAIDFWIVWRMTGDVRLRAAAAGTAVLTYLWLADGDWRSVGLRLVPEPGLRFWGRVVAAAVPFVVVVGCLAAAYVYHRLHRDEGIALYVITPATFWPAFVHACVVYPLVEELAFRAALCTPLAPVIGPWPAVLVSGATFAAVHFLYGNPGIDNFVAGYFLAWAFLKSGSILVPVLFHALGNFFILLGHMAAWTLTTPG
jgi:membrane protease YdiL (CAAX protease family)